MTGYPPKWAVVEIYTRQVVSIDGKARKGKCLRCGKCCLTLGGIPCEHIKTETLDGKTRHTCGIQNNKPLICLLFPVPGGPKVEGCGLYYEEQ